MHARGLDLAQSALILLGVLGTPMVGLSIIPMRPSVIVVVLVVVAEILEFSLVFFRILI